MHHSHRRSILTGIVFAILASACFATLDTTVQYLSAFVPILMALWFRYTFQTVVAAAVLLPLHGTAVLRTAHPKFHLVRGLLLLTSTFLAFSMFHYSAGCWYWAVLSARWLSSGRGAAVLTRCCSCL
jgi:hypothetical protein